MFKSHPYVCYKIYDSDSGVIEDVLHGHLNEFLFSPLCGQYLTHLTLSWFDHHNNIWQGVQIKNFFIMKFF